MKLNSALTKLKNLKSQVARVDGYITTSLTYYEGDEPEYNYVEEVENRRKLLGEIRALKTKIMQTNAVTKLNIKDNAPPVSINELMLLNAELRSELAHWTALLAVSLESPYGGRNKDTVKKRYAEGYSKAEIKTKLVHLEKSKEQVEGLLAQANADTDLVG